MKRIFLFLVAMVMLSGQYVTAQTPIEPTGDYNRVSLMYQYRDLSGNGTNGFEVGYIHGFSLSSTIPLFFQTGLKFDMGFDSETVHVSGIKVDGKLKTMSFSIPLDISYKIVFGDNSNVAFIPYAGFNLKYNAMGKITAKASHSGMSASESVSMFDEGMKHFQAGWHTGVGFQFSRVYVGADFGTDFVKVADGGNTTPTFHLGLGFTF